MRLLFILLPFLVLSQNTYEQAEVYFKKQQFNKAKPIFENYLKTHPSHLKTIEYLGDIAGNNKDWDAAIDYYEQLVESQSNVANYQFKYGGALGMKALSVSKIKAAFYIDDIKNAFETAAKLDPNHIETRWALVELYMQLPAIIGGSEEKSKKYANELAKLSPVDGHLAHGYIAEYANRPKEAEKFYKEAIKIGGSIVTYDKLTTLYEKNNQPKEAIENASIALKKHQRNQLNYQIGKIAADYNLEPNLGIICLQTYIKNFSPKDGVPKEWAYYRLAQIYKNIAQKETALEWINKALSVRPSFKEAQKEKKLILQI